MGINNNPYKFMAIISELLDDIKGIQTYLDNIYTTSILLEDHLQAGAAIDTHLAACH